MVRRFDMKYGLQGDRYEVYLGDTALGSIPWQFYHAKYGRSISNVCPNAPLVGGLVAIL